VKGLIVALPMVLGFVPTNTNAQQPFNTNDAPTIDKGNWQFQFLNSYDWLNKSVAPLSKQNWANVSLGYGVTRRMEVGVVIPHLAIRETAWNAGIGDTELLAKVQIIPVEPERRRPAVSIATRVEFPTGDSEKSLGSGYVDWDSTLIVESTFRGWTHRWNVGVTLFGNTSTGIEGILVKTTIATYSYSISRQVTKRLRWGSELTGADGTHVPFEKSEMELLTGGNYQISKSVSLDFAYSYGMKNASPNHGLVFGFTVLRGK
jgi:hypothetical protein